MPTRAPPPRAPRSADAPAPARSPRASGPSRLPRAALVLVEPSELLPCAEQPRADRGDALPVDLRELLVAQAGRALQHHKRRVLGPKLRERTRERTADIVSLRAAFWQTLEQADAAVAPTQRIDRRAPGGAIQKMGRRLAKRAGRPVAIQGEIGVLAGILRLLVRAREAADDRPDRREGRPVDVFVRTLTELDARASQRSRSFRMSRVYGVKIGRASCRERV